MFPEYTSLNLMLIVGLWLVLPLLSPDKKFCRAAVLLPMIPVQLCYIYWRYSRTLEVFEPSAAIIWQYVFFTTECLVVFYSVWQCLTLVRFTNRSAQCDRLIEGQKDNTEKSVDLFIPTHSESKNILTATIAAARNARYDNLEIWICDDSDRAWLRELCAVESVNYLSRPTNLKPRSKAANLAWSIPHGQGEYVICLDADFRLAPDLVARLTCFLSNPQIGLVQAPQHFRNLDPVQRNLLGDVAWTEEQRFFFDVSLASRDAWGNALCVGSCWATRRQIIDELGGYPVDSIVEDVYFGYLVKALGYEINYLNERLATGLAAEDTPSYIVQRTRWCLGSMALLSDPCGPLRLRGIGWLDRLFYLEIPFYWISHIHLFMLLLAPSLYGFFGFNVFNCSTEQLFTVLIPKNILLCAVFYWISRGRCMPLITPVQKTLTIFQVLPAIFRGLIFPRSVGFSVTRKDIRHNKRTIHWRLAAPFIAIGALTVLATGRTFLQNYSAFYWSDFSAYNAMLSAYSLVTVFLCCLVCVDKPLNRRCGSIPLTGSWYKTTVVISRRVFT